MTSTRFVVELPQHNSDREGTLVDIRASLSRLVHVTSAIFDRVEARIVEEGKRIEELENRAVKVKRRIASIASQPSKACTLISISKLPPSPATVHGGLLFADLPVQKLGEGESDEYRYKNRKNADEDEDPVVPHDALVELDRRIANTVSNRVRDVLEQTRELGDDQIRNNWWLPSSSTTESTAADDDEDGLMGPPPPSLQIHAKKESEGSPVVVPPQGRDVGYKPRSKEANQLGLPTNLGSFLPDIAEHSSLFPRVLPATSSVQQPHEAKQSGMRSPPQVVGSNKSAASIPSSSSTIQKIEEPTTSSQSTVSFNEPTNIVSSPVALTTAVVPEVVIPPKLPVASTSTSTLPVTIVADPSRRGLLAAIREAKPLLSHSRESQQQQQQRNETGDTQSKVKRPVSLADEMREKLARRQKALSGERDEEEQQAERKRKGRVETWEEHSSDSGSSLPSAPKAVSGKRSREPVPAPRSAAMPFAGLDALLNRELAAKSSIVPKPPPKPASSVGDWDDD